MIIENVTKGQFEFLQAKERFICFMAGRRFGKTDAIITRLVRDALKYPGHMAYYLTPDGGLCQEVFREITESTACKKRIRKIEQNPIRIIHWHNGSRTYIRMFDKPSKSLGFGFHLCIFDEIQKLESLNGRDAFMRVIRPLIADRRGTLIVAGQYRGMGCWWKKLWDSKKDNPNYKLFSFPSWEGYSFREGKENNPEICEMRESMPRVIFDQEIACLPTAAENAAFNFYDIQECVKGDFLDAGLPGHTYGIGADLGRTRDPSAWVVTDVGTNQVVYAKRRPLGEKHETGAIKLLELSRKFNNASVLFDATGGATGGKYDPDAFVRLYRKLIPNSRWIFMPVTIKAALIQDLSLAIEQHAIKIPSAAAYLIDELTLYEVTYTGYCYKYSAPTNTGMHDDLVIALALSWRCCTKGFSTQISASQAASIGAATLG